MFYTTTCSSKWCYICFWMMITEQVTVTNFMCRSRNNPTESSLSANLNRNMSIVFQLHFFIFPHHTTIIAAGLLIMSWLPELRIRVHMTEPFIWQLAAVDPIGEFAPAQTLITLHPVLIWSLPEAKTETNIWASRGWTWLDKHACPDF